MFGLFRKRQPTRTPSGPDLAPVILRDDVGPDDRRRLSARYASNGDLLIEGQDIGKSVEVFFGFREYEWSWTVGQADHPKLLKALGSKKNLLSEIKARFSGDDAGLIEDFLKSHGVPYSFSNRLGD